MSALLKNVFSDILHINKYKKLKMAYVYLLIFILFNYNQNFSLSFPKTVIISSSLLPITNGLFFNNFLLPKNFQCTHDSWYARRISSIIFLSCLHIMLTLYSNNKKPTSQPTRLAILYVAVQLILYFVLNDNDNINNSYKTLLCLITWFFYLAIIHFTDEKKYTQEMENLINIVSKNFKNLLDKYSLQADQLLQIASEYLQKETFYQKTNDTIGKKLFITPHSCYKDIVKNKNMHLKEQYLCDICRFDCQYKKNDTDKNKDCGYCVPILEYVFSINKETLDHTLQILNDITTANHPNRIYSNLESNQPHDQPIKKYFNQFQTINQLKDFFTNEIEDENLILNLDQEQP